jgi:hypothetical protein
MKYERRLAKLEGKDCRYSAAEFIFKKETETAEDAYKRGRVSYPGVGLLILVTWVSPTNDE